MSRFLPSAFCPLFCIAFLAFGTALDAAPNATPVEATVIAADAQTSMLTLQLAEAKEPIKVSVTPGDAAIGYVGQKITGNLLAQASGHRFENIWPEAPRWVADTTEQVHAETASRGTKAFRQVGEGFPAFALCNESGVYISRDTLLNQWSIITFIFTRCHNPYMCPALTNRMIELQGSIKDADIPQTQLYLLTFDPAYDTPGILYNYGKSRPIAADFKYTHFLTGNPSHVKDLMLQLGITRQGEQDHTMALLVVDPQGTIIYRKEGSNWSANEILALLREKRAKAEARVAGLDASKPQA